MFDFLTSRKEFNVDPCIFIRPDSEFIRESVCTCAKLIVDKEAHSWNWIKHWQILYENDTKRRIQLCVKIKKRCYTDLLHFSTRKHNLVFFFRPNHILTVELRRIFFVYSFFFQEKMLGDISFKLETKIMNFTSVFF